MASSLRARRRGAPSRRPCRTRPARARPRARALPRCAPTETGTCDSSSDRIPRSVLRFRSLAPVSCRLARVLALTLVVISGLAGVAWSADVPQATVTFVCPRASQPGRVKCELEARPAKGAVLKWADAVLVSAPPFITLLRARVGSGDTTTREDSVWHWTVALAARTRGTGDVEARVRVVSCVGDACVPTETTLRAALVVGD